MLRIGIVAAIRRKLRNELYVQLDAGTRRAPWTSVRLRRTEADAAVVVLGKCCLKRAVERGHQLGRGAEVRSEADDREARGSSPSDNSRPSGLHAREQLGIGIAEKVDGLHGVADDEKGAAGGFGPCGDQRGDELVLAAAGVLKFIDEEMANAVGDGECSVGGLPSSSWRTRRAICATSTKSATPASAKATFNWPAAWWRSVKQARTMRQSSSV